MPGDAMFAPCASDATPVARAGAAWGPLTSGDAIFAQCVIRAPSRCAGVVAGEDAAMLRHPEGA